MTHNEIQEMTDKELEAQRIYYTNRKEELRQFNTAYQSVDNMLWDIKKEIEKRESEKDVGKCFKWKNSDKYICSIGIYVEPSEHICLVIEDSQNIDIDYFNWIYVTRNSSYEEISKEEFLNQYLAVVKKHLHDIDPNMSMVFKKEVAND